MYNSPTYYLTSISDVDNFLSRFTHDNNYKDGNEELAVGNRIYIGSTTSSDPVWIIAGFDVEHSKTAADGTVYDNGYGIALVPGTTFEHANTRWDSSINNIPYLHSDIFKATNNSGTPGDPATTSSIFTNLRYASSHFVKRNLLLSDKLDSSGYSCSYKWTQSYMSLLSYAQITGSVGTMNTIYDDGEANYQLPLFKYEGIRAVYGNYWLRNINNTDSIYYVSSSREPYSKYYKETIYSKRYIESCGIAGMIYIR